MGGTLQHVVQTSDVQALFFSRTNVNALQEGIRYRVFQETEGTQRIGMQSETELGLVMRSVYLEHSRNVDDANVLGQVRDLNARVLDYCVPRILEELRAYTYYQRDVNSLPMPMDRGQFASSKGERSLTMMP